MFNKLVTGFFVRENSISQNVLTSNSMEHKEIKRMMVIKEQRQIFTENN